MNARSLDDIRRLTRYYRYLQGLKIVPMGVALTVLGAVVATGSPGSGAAAALPVALTVFSAAGYWAMWLLYRRRYGKVEEAPPQAVRSRTMLWGSTIAGAVLGVVAGTGAVPLVAVGPVLTLGAAGLKYVYWRWTGSFLAHYPVLAAVLSAGAVAGLALGVAGVVPALSVLGSSLVLCGVAFIVAGVLDHRWLLARMAPVEDGAP